MNALSGSSQLPSSSGSLDGLHLALRAVAVEGDSDGRSLGFSLGFSFSLGLLPLGNGGRGLGHGDSLAGLLHFLANQPARELHALRRGEFVLRQGKIALSIGQRRFHLALAAVGVKGDGEHAFILPQRQDGYILLDGDLASQ